MLAGVGNPPAAVAAQPTAVSSNCLEARMKTLTTLTCAGLLAATATARAAILLTEAPTVGTPDRHVGFEHVSGDALASLPASYSEDGMTLEFAPPSSFYRYTFTQATTFFGPFVGNNPSMIGRAAYFSSDGTNLYPALRIFTADGADLAALQLNVDSGYAGTLYGYWEAYRDTQLVGQGNVTTSGTDLLFGFIGDTFDELRIGTYFAPFGSFGFQGTNGNAILIDNIAAQLSLPNQLPEPSMTLLMGLALTGCVVVQRRSQRRPLLSA